MYRIISLLPMNLNSYLINSFLAHIATDLELTTADTLLHILKDKKLDKKEIQDDSCNLSMKKRQFEKMSNLTPST